jgi:hypothetical protein
MSNNNQLPSTPGLQLPTQKGMLAGNPRDSAIASQTQTNTKQTNLINAVGGKRTKGKKWGGAAAADPNANKVVVPQFQMQYQPTGGPGQDPNSVIQQNSQTSTQSTANAVYDNYATQQGGTRRTKKRRSTGSRKKRKGGSNKYTWGCFSGGKSRGKKRYRGHSKRRN